MGSLTVALFNAALVLGTILLGAQTDRSHVTDVILVSAVGASVSVFMLWGFSTALPTLCIFSIVYGFFAGAFSTSWTAIIRELRLIDSHADAGIMFGMFAAGRGIGNIVSGPISETLLATGSWQGFAELGYGTPFGGLIVFVGVTAMLSGSSWLGRKAGWV